MQYIRRGYVLIIESHKNILPMYQKFTQEDSDLYCHVMDREVPFRDLNPREETLVLIMQFAGAYHVEMKLPAGLSGIILN